MTSGGNLLGMDWQLTSSLIANVLTAGGLLWRWSRERAPSVTIRQTKHSPYPRFEDEAGLEPNIINRYYAELELTNTSRKLSVDSYDILFDFGTCATVDHAECTSKSSLRPVEELEQSANSRKFRVRNFEPGDTVTFRFKLANVNVHECKIDGYSKGLRLRRIQLKNGLALR